MTDMEGKHYRNILLRFDSSRNLGAVTMHKYRQHIKFWNDESIYWSCYENVKIRSEFKQN